MYSVEMMNKVRVFLGFRDRAFSEKLRDFSGKVVIAGEADSWPSVKDRAREGDLVFLDRIPYEGLGDREIRKVLVMPRYSRKEEFWAAQSGMQGFITRGVSRPLLLKAIQCVTAGEIWMSRYTIARLFEEYARLMQSKPRVAP